MYAANTALQTKFLWVMCGLHAVTFLAVEMAIISLLSKQLLLWKQLLFTLPCPTHLTVTWKVTPSYVTGMPSRLKQNVLCFRFVPVKCTPVFIQCAQQRLPTRSHSDRPHDAVHLSVPVPTYLPSLMQERILSNLKLFDGCTLCVLFVLKVIHFPFKAAQPLHNTYW